jgi:hypothetical protein
MDRRRQESPKTLHIDVVDIRGTLFHGPRSENARNEKGALRLQLSLGPLQCSFKLQFSDRLHSACSQLPVAVEACEGLLQMREMFPVEHFVNT